MTRKILLGTAIAAAIGIAAMPTLAADARQQINALLGQVMSGNLAQRQITALPQQTNSAAILRSGVDVQALVPNLDLNRLMPEIDTMTPPCGGSDADETVIVAARDGLGSVRIDSSDAAGNDVSIVQSGVGTYAEVIQNDAGLSRSLAIAGDDLAPGCVELQ